MSSYKDKVEALALKANAQPGVDVVKIEAPQIPPSMIQLSELLGKGSTRDIWC
jgi:hypothetical protein